MLEHEALSKMVPPSKPRPNAWRQGIVQIHITRACDKACFGCTQGSNLGGKTEFMSPENFEKAVRSMDGYFGVLGIFGGNPAISPYFVEYCLILRNLVPFERRGLWCNNPLGKGAIMRETFNPKHSNLNVHLDQKAYDEFKRDWPECEPVGLTDDSRHSPVHGSMIDLGIPEEERWYLISRCPINQGWSAQIGMFRGELRAWFCEVAGAQSILKQHDPNYPDTGLPVKPDWWRSPMGCFSEQVRQHCHNCLVPLNGYGELAMSETGTERTTESYADIYKPKRTGRPVEIVKDLIQLQPQALQNMTDYIGNARHE